MLYILCRLVWYNNVFHCSSCYNLVTRSRGGAKFSFCLGFMIVFTEAKVLLCTSTWADFVVNKKEKKNSSVGVLNICIADASQDGSYFGEGAKKLQELRALNSRNQALDYTTYTFRLVFKIKQKL
ncbi:hypothetical protein NQ317_011700 [Molorchus minor]|uniref:Uncharacterized protein n=1 Tax=Molorchus minor TaxID=1323400 RepID=A0ABQ9JRW8_9CUCU|nr:hypothetical protein NQ317_011700 [Molorchus minor]